MLLVVALTVAACADLASDRDGSRVATRPPPPAPGAEGREVLWIDPHLAHPLGRLDATTNEAIEAIEAADGASAGGVERLRSFLSDPRTRVRHAAVVALSMASHPLAHRGLLAARLDAHPVVRSAATDALTGLDAPTRDALFDACLTSDDVDCARGAALAWPDLLRHPSADAVGQRLLSALKQTSDPVAAALLLRGRCGRLGAQPLVEAAANDARVLVRAAATACRLDALVDGATGDPGPLVEALGLGDGAAVRVAARMLAPIADKIAPERRADVEAALASAIGLDDPLADVAVAEARAALGDRQGEDTLAVFVRTGGETVRLRALTALRDRARSGRAPLGADLAPALERAAQSTDAAVRTLVAQVAGRLPDARTGATLVRLLADDAVDVRVAAAFAIARAGVQRLAPVLVDPCLTDPSPAVRDACFVALHHLVHEHPLPPPGEAKAWLDSPPDVDGERPVWGRDLERWRRWLQVDRR